MEQDETRTVRDAVTIARESLPRRARIKDVAAAAGVSAMTASRALRGVEGVSARKRDEIARLATAMNYVPNGNARSLVAAHSSLIGISLPNLLNDVFPEILVGLRRVLIGAGFETVIDTTEYDPAQEEAWIRRLMGWSPAAVILTGMNHTEASRRWLQAAAVPTLEIWDCGSEPVDVCVGIDHHAAGREIGAYAARLGYRRPCYVGMAAGYDTRADARLDGIREAFRDAADAPVTTAHATVTASFQAGYEGVEIALARTGPRPDLFFFLSDHLAFGGLMALQAAGVGVPDDVGVIGFNALNITGVLPVSLTTVRTPRHQMGLTGARHLLARIHGVTVERRTALPIEIIEGRTTRLQGRANA